MPDPTNETPNSTEREQILLAMANQPDTSTITIIPLCSDCSEPIPDPAERWPSFATGIVCQVCWEAQSSRIWWAMVRLLPEDGTHAA